MGEVVRGILPFLVIVLTVISYVLAFTLWLPDIIFGR